MGKDQCEVPCKWTVDTTAMREAHVNTFHPFYDPGQAGMKKQRDGQKVAVFSMEPIFG